MNHKVLFFNSLFLKPYNIIKLIKHVSVISIINHSNQQKLNHNRIVSLVPSQTELLHYLNLDNEVVGITKFCIHPKQWFQNKKRIGGTKNINLNAIKQLQPTLVIANKEENVQSQIEELATICPVVVTNISTLNDALEMIAYIGNITNKTNEANLLNQQIQTSFKQLNQFKQRFTPQKVAYFIWKNPYMVAGNDTFISTMLEACGFENVFSNNNRYPEVSIEALQQLNVQTIFLSSEPYPFKQKHIQELQQLLPETKIKLVNGEFFSWYGSKLVDASRYFMELLQELNN